MTVLPDVSVTVGPLLCSLLDAAAHYPPSPGAAPWPPGRPWVGEDGRVRLREVEPEDIPVFYEHQADPESVRMVAFRSRDRQAHAAHLERIRTDPEVVIRTIVEDGAVAGQVLSFPRDGVREVGYWLGREFWGRGIASAALGEFLTIDTSRPLYGVVAEHNTASRRVLERHGFVLVDRHEPDPDLPPELAVPMLVLRLDA
jgi:RimJ/RimL family protein N-acetyltransferase